jgi:hypothetical protein
MNDFVYEFHRWMHQGQPSQSDHIEAALTLCS